MRPRRNKLPALALVRLLLLTPQFLADIVATVRAMGIWNDMETISMLWWGVVVTETVVGKMLISDFYDDVILQ